MIDWSKVDKDDYLLAMERSPIKDVEIKTLLRAALTDKINDREVYMKGIDASYHYVTMSLRREIWITSNGRPIISKLVNKHGKYFLHIPVTYDVEDSNLSDVCNSVLSDLWSY